MTHATTLRLGARGSLLSRMQSTATARLLEAAHPGPPPLRVDLVIVTTSGDVIQNRPLPEFGGKGLFTKELEQALLRNDVDFAVHSFKDVPVTMPLVDTADLVIAAVPPREDPRDLLASRVAKNLLDLPKGAKVGTGSLRRGSQLLALRPDLQVLPIRGNVDTRLRKLSEGQYDAVILATAGIKRANLFDASFMTPIDTAQMLPAAGQAALALQCRRDDAATRHFLAALNDGPSALAASLERDVVRLLNGDCHSPIAALATVTADAVRLQAAVAAKGGHPPVLHADLTLPRSQSSELPQKVVNDLVRQGAAKLLAGE
jgi:hydroxymethylbilane synthase